MKRFTILWSIICAIVFSVVLPITADAQETVFRTDIPSEHSLHLTINGQGIVIIDGKQYSKTTNVPIQRHSEPFVEIQAAKDYYIRSVTYNQENITHLFNSGKRTMPKVESDISLSVVFVKDSGNPPTGDAFNHWITVLITASVLGLIVCVLNARKNKRI